LTPFEGNEQMKQLFLLLTFSVSFTLTSCLWNTNAAQAPGSMKLLPGYQHKTEFSPDTATGKIWKEGGITIRYHAGNLQGYNANPEKKGDYLWFKEQFVNDQKVRIALTSDRELIVSFPDDKTDFYGSVRTEEELTDALLMILTF
jgi:hypothetical protein